MSVLVALLIAQVTGMTFAVYVSNKGTRMTNLVRSLVPSSMMWIGTALYLAYYAAENHARVNFDPFWSILIGIANLAVYGTIAKISSKTK